MKRKITSSSVAPKAAMPLLGILELFRPGEHDRVESVLRDLQALGVTELRTGISWADWMTPGGEAWYEWLLPRLSRQVNVLPCFVYTPPSLGVEWKSCAPPRDPKWYGDFIDQVITRLGDHFEYVEFWNEPNNLREWDVTLDPEWWTFSAMVGGAAYWAKQRGKKTVLGGTSPIDPHWLRLMCERGVMQYIDVVGVHGFPVTFEFWWEGWTTNVDRVRDILDKHGSKAEIWITETGYSTWRHDERRQLAHFLDALDAPVERVYWYAAQDLDPRLPTVDGFHSDEREYHFGLRRSDGAEKLLYRMWAQGGLSAVRRAAGLGATTRLTRPDRPALITGGAGFIGSNVAHRLLSQGRDVLLFDNLSRPGVERNVHWLRETHGDRVQIEIADVRDEHALARAVKGASQVYHFAAQVAVTTSLVNPIHDFEVNARGTVNLLEVVRRLDAPPPVLFTSTNKVYGDLEDIVLLEEDMRYAPDAKSAYARGVAETRRLDFHSPYGCSKGTADQYVLDYARSFDLQAVVFRMSCIYGPRQFGTEDQGWIAHFLIRALKGLPITLYGDGKQVRDVLFIDDLVDAFLLAQENIGALSGQAFNIGGGSGQTISLIELLDLIGEMNGRRPNVAFEDWRTGDQRWYVSQTQKFEDAAGWKQRVGVREGVRRLLDWLREVHIPAFEAIENSLRVEAGV